MDRAKKRYIDPRVKLLHIMLSIVAFIVVTDYDAILIFLGFDVLLFIYFGRYRSAIRYSVAIAILLLFFELYAKGILISTIGFMYTFFFLVFSILPVIMAGGIFMGTTQVTDMIASFRKMKLPYSFVITFAVTMRFIPTIKHEFWYIKNSMKIRGISFSVAGVVRQPIKTVEYILVPLLFRSGKVADELAESVTTRAIEYPCEKTSLKEIKFTINEFAYITCLLVVFVGVALWKLS